MEAVREAIRRALAKGDAQDRTFREKIYRQAFAALDRSLQARSDLSREETQRRREQVKAIIVEIERGFRHSAESGTGQESSAPQRDEATAAAPSADFVPRVEREDRFDTTGNLGRRPAGDETFTSGVNGSKGRPLAMILTLAVLIVAGVGIWWAYQSGLWQTAERTNSPGLAPAVEENSDSGNQAPIRSAGGVETTNGDWITIFSPGDPTAAKASAGTSAEVLEREEGTFLRIGGGSTDAAVSFDVGQGVLERLAGKRAIFSLTARVAEGNEGQVSISCDFGALGDCGRMRYVVGPQPAEYLFEVELPDQRPSAGGSIMIVPDIEGRGRMLDVFDVRVAVAQN